MQTSENTASDKSQRVLVIVPTYNEKENIQNFLTQLVQVDPILDVLVVDDSSPDKTYELVENFSQTNSRVQLLLRKQKEGLGMAYQAGFKRAIEQGYAFCVQMDADFSHRMVDLKKLIDQRNNYDLVIGSRYTKGGETVNWGFIRKLISRGGSVYSKLVLGYTHINDWTAGFNLWRLSGLSKILENKIKSNGYSFQIELKYRAQKLNLRTYEQPIVFEDRRIGKSKMSFKILLEALYKVWLIRL